MTDISKKALLALSIASVFSSGVAWSDSPNDLFDLSVEELVNLEVTSVSRKSERLADTTSAVFVITQDDLQRHGVRSIPDALRLAPGLTVLQIDANKWAIGSRGYTGRYSNQLLVLKDGRLLYTPTFSGVFWDVQHTLIDEIDRIEVIRGPGAVVWGTNAVAGVINIITKSSRGAPGVAVSGGLDPEGAAFFAAHRQGELTESASYRAFVKYLSADGNELVGGGDGADEWDLIRGSFRTDINGDDSELTITAEGYVGTMGHTLVQFDPLPPYQAVSDVDADVSGAFVLASWTREHDSGARTSAQAYIDHTDRDAPLYKEKRTTYSFDLQHQRTFGRHEVVTGGWLRANRYDLSGSERLTFVGDIDGDRVISVFIQDDISIVPDKFSIEVGLKLENNELSQDTLEYMPTVRALWKPAEQHTVWAAATRAVRTPSPADLGTAITDINSPIAPGDPANPFPLPLRAGSNGNPDFKSESNVAVELGMRGQLSENLSYDIALFEMQYKDIRSLVPTDVQCNPSGTSVFVDPFCLATSDSVIAVSTFSNANDTRTRGGEISLDWMPFEQLRFRTAVSYARETPDVVPPAIDISGTYPEWQFSLRTEWSPTDRIDIGALVRYVDEIRLREIDDYWQANLNVRMELGERWLLSSGVRNLLGSQLEYQSEFADIFPTEIERSAYLNLRYSY